MERRNPIDGLPGSENPARRVLAANGGGQEGRKGFHSPGVSILTGGGLTVSLSAPPTVRLSYVGLG